MLLQVHQSGTDFLQLMGDAGDLPVSPVGFQVMGEDALPVSLLSVMNRMPVPVFHHIGAAGQVSEHVQPELAVIWRELRL